MGYIIEVEGLTKKFKDFTAVNSINLKIKEGEIFGFLGPNGAGKTTTISMLTTLLTPTSGKARIGGYDLHTDGVMIRNIIGVVPQNFALFPELTASENLAYIGKLYGLTDKEIRERSERLLKTVDLYDAKDRIAGIFSGGMKQRLSLAASIISHPQILFMDEPTTGLDPQSRIAMRELTRQLNKEGMTIIYTTHDMDEADKICDRISIMDKGRIIAEGTSAHLKEMISTSHVVEVEIEQCPPGLAQELKKLPFIRSVDCEAGLININVDRKAGVFYHLSDFFHRRNLKVEEIRFKEHTLEDVFIQLTNSNLRD